MLDNANLLSLEVPSTMLNMHFIDIWQQFAVIIDGAIAAFLGSIIGWERDRAGKSAGPRTMALVGTAAHPVLGDRLCRLGLHFVRLVPGFALTARCA